MMMVITLCNTVVPEAIHKQSSRGENVNGLTNVLDIQAPSYQAESPDELALVMTARDHVTIKKIEKILYK